MNKSSVAHLENYFNKKIFQQTNNKQMKPKILYPWHRKWWVEIVGLMTFYIGVIAIVIMGQAYARDGDDHGNHGELKAWFDGLRSDLGLCCSFADGEVIEDADYDTQDGHFRVFLDGQWRVVKDEAVIKAPNKFGKAVVWPIRYNGTVYDIRCFMPGAGT